MEQLLNGEQAAKRLGLNRSTIFYHVQRGALRPAMRVGKYYFFTFAELDRFAAERETKETTTPEPAAAPAA